MQSRQNFSVAYPKTFFAVAMVHKSRSKNQEVYDEDGVEANNIVLDHDVAADVIERRLQENGHNREVS